jgi:hypothetical protein
MKTLTVDNIVEFLKPIIYVSKFIKSLTASKTAGIESPGDPLGKH